MAALNSEAAVRRGLEGRRGRGGRSKWEAEVRSGGREHFQKLELQGRNVPFQDVVRSSLTCPQQHREAILGCPELDSKSSFNSEILYF